MSAADALARIDRNDAELQAWVHVDRDAAQAVPANGPLAGMPFGVKDIIDVRGMPTRYGLQNFGVAAAPLDAWCVAALRAAGAIPIGKTHTTALAFRDPAPTRNPHHPAHTPGGSSSGSAAAVSAGHVPFALGTQTLGSVVRPSAFCGVVGYKPTHAAIPGQGVMPQAPSLDTVGIIAANVQLTAQIAAVFLTGLDAAPVVAPRVAVAPDAFGDRFEPAVHAALAAAADGIAAAGATLERIALPPIVADAIAPHWTIARFEARAELLPLRAHGLPPLVDAYLADAAATTYDTYREAREFQARTRRQIAALLERYDVLVLACANPAPDRASTGDVVPFMPWTFWGLPALTLPVARSVEGLPIGVQLVAAPGADATLLRTARWIERALA